MRTEEAVRVILGNKLAGAIIDDQGIHWAIFAAVAQAKTNDDPRALAALRAWLALQKGEHPNADDR